MRERVGFHLVRRELLKRTLAAIGIVLIVLAGCRSAASPQEAAPVAQATAAPTATALPPTSTPLPPPPTATPAPPTATATPREPIPTADFTLQDIVGTWTRNDADRGQLFINIGESGKYGAAHGTPDSVVHGGTYTLDGRVLTFVSGWDTCPAGSYLLRLVTSAGKKVLFFDPLSDADCADRYNTFRGRRWDRYVPK
ncbi:MAG: hypothetical protein IT330_14225 [Anaerolineae bacterium]|nr:hypothetical protein [Anaerolineae bacterium]